MDTRLQDDLRAWLQDDAQREQALLSSGYQGSAYLYEHGGNRLVIKKAGGGALTGWLHRHMLRREARVYQHLTEVSGVPHSPGMLDGRWLLLEFVDGVSLKEARRTLQHPEVFYDRLREVIAAFHAVGVAHGDLKRKDNVLVMAGEQPCVIDFGTAVMRDGSLLDRLLFRLVRRFDYNAWIKVKYARDYEAISAEDQQWYRPTIVERGFRTIRRLWRIITFRQARKRRRNNKRST
jgi:predicted Ser/Thr protein kinase